MDTFGHRMVTPDVDRGVSAQFISEAWIVRQRDHVLCHLIYSAFFNKESGLSLDDHVRDPGVSSRHNRESRRPGFQD